MPFIYNHLNKYKFLPFIVFLTILLFPLFLSDYTLKQR